MDLTNALDDLGNPLEQRYASGDKVYARNIWDMQTFGGRVYYGWGNSNNKGPAPNAGPVRFTCYDPAKGGQWKDEGEAREEQIDVFRILGGKLVVPGHDPKQSWAHGNFYRLEGTSWKQHRTIPLGIHTYDIALFKGELFAALGTPLLAAVARSKDDGKKWESMLGFGSFRARTLMVIDKRLFCSASGGTFYRYEEDSGSMAEFNADFFPGGGAKKGLFAARALDHGGTCVYIAGRAEIDHNWLPVGLYTAKAAGSSTKVALPGGALPRDVVSASGTLHVLGQSGKPGAVVNHVFAGKSAGGLTEVLRFTSATFARSFEILEGDYYFGMGCEAGDLSPLTGRIFRAKASSLSAKSAPPAAPPAPAKS